MQLSAAFMAQALTDATGTNAKGISKACIGKKPFQSMCSAVPVSLPANASVDNKSKLQNVT